MGNLDKTKFQVSTPCLWFTISLKSEFQISCTCVPMTSNGMSLELFPSQEVALYGNRQMDLGVCAASLPALEKGSEADVLFFGHEEAFTWCPGFLRPTVERTRLQLEGNLETLESNQESREQARSQGSGSRRIHLAAPPAKPGLSQHPPTQDGTRDEIYLSSPGLPNSHIL